MRTHDNVLKSAAAGPQRRHNFSSMFSPPSHSDFLMVGAGIVGLRAAIELASAGTVLVLSKGEMQGTTAPALSNEDEISLHLQDTLQPGCGRCMPKQMPSSTFRFASLNFPRI
jgi:heterodisulfide reductase subunit A-like polyferredoxin